MQRTVTQVTPGCWRDRNELAEDDYIAVGSEDEKLASAAELVDAPWTSAWGRASSLGLSSVQRLDVANVDLVAKRRFPGGARSGPRCSKTREPAVSRWT